MLCRAGDARSSFCLVDKFVVGLLSDTLLCVLAPLDAGYDIVVDHEPAVVAGHLEVIGENLNLVPALGTFFEFSDGEFKNWKNGGNGLKMGLYPDPVRDNLSSS